MTEDSRGQTLDRVREGLRGLRPPDAATHHPGSFAEYPPVPPPGHPALVSGFGDELAALKGVMHRAAGDADAARVALQILELHGARRVLSWSEQWIGCPGLVATLEADGVRFEHADLARDDPARHDRLVALDPIPAGLTGAFAGLADTGSLVLVHGPGRSRMASLLPPVHIAVLRQARLFATLPAFLDSHPGVVNEGSNLVLVTGPSRTADIEMTITHGVHGPREVHVIVVP